MSAIQLSVYSVAIAIATGFSLGLLGTPMQHIHNLVVVNCPQGSMFYLIWFVVMCVHEAERSTTNSFTGVSIMFHTGSRHGEYPHIQLAPSQ